MVLKVKIMKKNALLQFLFHAFLGLLTSLLIYGNPPLIAVAQVPLAELEINYPKADFRSTQTLTRAEMAVIALTYPNPKVSLPSEKMKLTDMTENHWASDMVQKVIALGIMQPQAEGQFFPDMLVTRSEAFSILVQASGVPSISPEEAERILADYQGASQIPDWARTNMAIALQQKIVNLSGNNIRPQDLATEGDVMYAMAQQVETQKNPPIEKLIDFESDQSLNDFLEQSRNKHFIDVIVRIQQEEVGKTTNFFDFSKWAFLVTGIGLVWLVWRIWKVKKQRPRRPSAATSLTSSLQTLKITNLNSQQTEYKSLEYGAVNIANNICQVQLTDNDNLQITTQRSGVNCSNNAIPTTPQGLTFNGQQALVIQAQQQQWQIEALPQSIQELRQQQGSKRNFFQQVSVSQEQEKQVS